MRHAVRAPIARFVRCAFLLAVGCAVTTRPSRALAQPLRLRGDALAQAQAPLGLLVLSGQSELKPWLRAEALVWAGAGDDEDADVLTVSVTAQHPIGQAKLGRFVMAAGALRPVHIDGAAANVRLPAHVGLELFGGLPVIARNGPQGHEWLAGGRVRRTIGDWGALGAAYLHRRDHGQLADEEAGADLALFPFGWLDLGASAAYDLATPGLAELQVSGSVRGDRVRVEVFGAHRSPSRILPATSLFSVLGDVPARTAGATFFWRLAPRLDTSLLLAAKAFGLTAGADLAAGTVLRLDDRGEGTLSLELRRQKAPDGDWSGLRAAGRVPLALGFGISAELELAVPDEPRGRGALWPWALGALRWRAASSWEAAAAVEASRSPEHLSRVDALVRVAYSWGGP